MEKITKNLIPVAIVVSGLIIAGAFFYFNQSFSGDIGAQRASQKTIDYINQNFLTPGTTASLVNILDVGSVYKIRLAIEGAEFDSYVSKDGEFLFPEGYNMNQPLVEDIEAEVPVEIETPPLSQEESGELKRLIQCLADADLIFYGTKTCPACIDLAAQLGGYDIIDPIFVDCAEESELCAEKEIQFVPTIFIDNEEYLGARSLEAFAQETGCSL